MTRRGRRRILDDDDDRNFFNIPWKLDSITVEQRFLYEPNYIRILSVMSQKLDLINCSFSVLIHPFLYTPGIPETEPQSLLYLSFAHSPPFSPLWGNEYVSLAHWIIFQFCIIFTSPTSQQRRNSPSQGRKIFKFKLTFRFTGDYSSGEGYFSSSGAIKRMKSLNLSSVTRVELEEDQIVHFFTRRE